MVRTLAVVTCCLLVFVLCPLVVSAQGTPDQASYIWGAGVQLGAAHAHAFNGDRGNLISALSYAITNAKASTCLDAAPMEAILKKVEGGMSPRAVFPELDTLVKTGYTTLGVKNCACTGVPSGHTDWVLMEVKEDPGRQTVKVPQVYEGEAMGGHRNTELRRGLYRYDILDFDKAPGGSRPLGRQMIFQMTFDEPPARIAAGSAFDLVLRGQLTGSKLDGSFGISGRIEGPGLQPQGGGLYIGAVNGPNPYVTSGQFVYHFTAQGLPDVFSISEIATGVGTVAEYKYCKNAKCN